MTVGSESAHSRPPDLLHARNHRTDVITQVNSTPRVIDTKKQVDDSSDTAHPTVHTITMEVNNNKLPHSRHNVAPIYIIPDHSLSNDWHLISTSPGSTFMYESDPADQNKALLSPGTSELIHSPMALTAGSMMFKQEDAKKPTLGEEDSITLTNCDMSLWCQMDGPPIQDYLTDFINAPDGSSIKAIGDELAALTTPTCIKQEPGLGCEAADCSGIIQSEKMDAQMGLKDKMVDGPTLAQLNDGESVLDMFMPLGGPAVTSQSWTSDSPQATVMASTLSTITRSSSNISMTATVPSWEESYSFATSSSGVTQVPPLQIKSEPLTRASLSSCRIPGAVSNIQIQTSVSNERKQRPAVTVLSTASFGVPTVTVPNSQALGLTGLKVSEGARPPTNKSLQELLSVAMTSSETPKVIAVAPHPEGMRGKKRSLSPDTSSNGSGGSMERKWEEIRCYIDSNIKLEEEKRLAEAQRELAESLAHKRVKVEPQGLQIDDHDDEDVEDDALSIKQELDSDFDNSDDDLSDVESNASYSSFVDEILHGDKKEKRYFWQYNTQSKGPKGKRLCKSMQERDPHSLADFEDPVFQPEVNDVRYKHNGKARKGDGNDITPSPWKLFQIGNELQKLTKKINGIAETEKPVKTKDGVKSKSRKEKNKFASRACRLKKKAQHEANKVKLYGLESEHHQLMEVLKAVKKNIYLHIKDNVVQPDEESFTSMLESQIKEKLTTMIAGNTSDYVNTVLQKVAEGDKKGGIFPNRN